MTVLSVIENEDYMDTGDLIVPAVNLELVTPDLSLVPPEPGVIINMGDQFDHSSDLSLPKPPQPSFDEMVTAQLTAAYQEAMDKLAQQMIYGGGGYFVPPVWLVSDYIPIGYAGFAASGMSINIPKVSMGYGSHPTVRSLVDLFPALNDHTATCPECNEMTAPLHSVIVHLNDRHEWKREHIADWLEILPVDLTIQPKKGDTDVRDEAA